MKVWVQLLLVRDQIQEPKTLMNNICKSLSANSYMRGMMSDCLKAFLLTARTLQGPLCQVEDIFRAKRRDAVLLASVACADQLRYEGIAQHLAQLYEYQADLEQLQRLTREARLTYLNLQRTSHAERPIRLPEELQMLTVSSVRTEDFQDELLRLRRVNRENLGLAAEWDEELRLSSWIDLSSGDHNMNSGQA